MKEFYPIAEEPDDGEYYMKVNSMTLAIHVQLMISGPLMYSSEIAAQSSYNLSEYPKNSRSTGITEPKHQKQHQKQQQQQQRFVDPSTSILDEQPNFLISPEESGGSGHNSLSQSQASIQTGDSFNDDLSRNPPTSQRVTRSMAHSYRDPEPKNDRSIDGSSSIVSGFPQPRRREPVVTSSFDQENGTTSRYNSRPPPYPTSSSSNITNLGQVIGKRDTPPSGSRSHDHYNNKSTTASRGNDYIHSRTNSVTVQSHSIPPQGK